MSLFLMNVIRRLEELTTFAVDKRLSLITICKPVEIWKRYFLDD